MTANKVLLSVLLVIVCLSGANALLCGLLSSTINTLCLLVTFGKCTLDLSGLTVGCNEPIEIELLANKEYILNLNVPYIAGLKITADGGAKLSVDLGLGVTIAGDLSVLGANVTIGSGFVLNVGGNVMVGKGSNLHVSGILNVIGNTKIQSGNLRFTGPQAHGSAQSAWLNSTVTIVGTPSDPACITGNGGIDGNVTVQGNATTGTQSTNSEIYISKELLIEVGAQFKLAGNVTAEGGVRSFGQLHLNGILDSNTHQYSWLTSNSVLITGTPSERAKLTGNGGIEGDVTLGEYSIIAAGNSPGAISVGGNLLMNSNSVMDIEVASPTSFDKYVVTKSLFRNGYLYTTFLGGFIPYSNDRFSFCSHQNATGIFQSGVLSSQGDVLAAYSNRSTMFIYDDPQRTSYCSCVNA